MQGAGRREGWFTWGAGLLLGGLLFGAMGLGSGDLWAERLPDEETTRQALKAGFLRIDEYSIRREGERRLVFTEHAEPGKYGYGAFWLLPAIVLIWKVYRRIREKPRNWWRKLGWKLNIGIPLYVFACVLVTWSGTRIIMDAGANAYRHETTWAGLGVKTLRESPLKDARSLRILTLTADKHKKKGDEKFALALEWGAGTEPARLFIIKTKHERAKAARAVLRVMEVYTADTAGLRRFQK